MPSAEPSDNLYVTGLPDLDDGSLRQIFEAIAPVAQCRMLPSKQPGMKRAAFVRFQDAETAAAVAESVNAGAVPLGLSEPVAAQFAPPPGKAQGGQGQGAYGRAGGAEHPARASPYWAAAPAALGNGTPQDNLYATLLPPDMDNWSLAQLFGQYGTVVQARVLPPKQAGGKCAALVRYSSAKEAASVLQGFQAGQILQDFPEPIGLKFADEGKGQGKGYEQTAVVPYGKGGGGGEGQSVDNLYATLLPPDIDSATIMQVFGQFGTVVSCKVLPTKIPGGKCAAFVRYATAEEASSVLQNWQNGSILQDFPEPIALKFAEQWPSGGSAGKGGEASSGATGRGDYAPPSSNLYVTLLPSDADWELVTRIFGQYGNVAQCKVLPCTQPGGKCAALVRYSSMEEAAIVKEGLHGNIPSGLQEPVRVQFAAPSHGYGDSEGKGGYGDGKGKGGYGDGWGKGGCGYGGKGGKGGYGDGGWKGGYGDGGGKGGYGDSEGKGSYGDDGGKGGNDYGDGGGKGGYGYGDGGGKGGYGDGGGKGGPPEEFTADLLVQGFEMSGRIPGGPKFCNDANTLYVSGLPADMSDLHLYRIFASFGPIAVKGVRALKNADGSCRGVGFVNFLTQEAAQSAIAAYHGTELPDGNVLKVQVKK